MGSLDRSQECPRQTWAKLGGADDQKRKNMVTPKEENRAFNEILSFVGARDVGSSD